MALAISALLLLLLMTFGFREPRRDKPEFVSVVSLEAREIAQDRSHAQPAQSNTPQAQRQDLPPPPSEPPPVPPIPQPSTPQPPVAPPAPALAEPQPAPEPLQTVIRPSSGKPYGPPDTGGGSSSAYRDSQRVGTAPNGEPLYAAAWYREPGRDELRGYLSTADGPGWGLIACRTAPDYRVEDCVGLDEYPTGSQINRALLAAAWQFRVRAPRLGGRSLVGGWVRIRIDYGIERR